jgi:hypothetical protein
MDDELFGDNADMHAWTAGADIGREFRPGFEAGVLPRQDR